MQQNQPVQAVLAYRSALQLQPGDPFIIERLVDSTLAAHRTDLALVYFRQLIALRGWTPDRYRKMAQILSTEDDTRQALVYWQASLTGAKADVPTLRTLADQAIVDHDWETAEAMLNQLITLDPVDYQSLYKLGLALVPVDPEHGLTYLDRAAVDPQYRETVTTIRASINAITAPEKISYQIGLDLMSINAWTYAERAFTASLTQGSTTPMTLAFLGMAQDQQGRDGWAAIDKAYAADPVDPTVNYAVALHWRLKGDANKALLALVRAEALDPRNPAIAAEMGLAYQMIGRLDEAALWLNQAVALAPNNAGFRSLLANFYASTRYNLSGEGLTAIQKIADESPNDADIHASLGWALYSSNQLDAARVELDKALLLDPTNIRARYYLGVLLEYRGDVEGATSAYLYVYRDPSNNGFKDLAAGALTRLGYIPQ